MLLFEDMVEARAALYRSCNRVYTHHGYRLDDSIWDAHINLDVRSIMRFNSGPLFWFIKKEQIVFHLVFWHLVLDCCTHSSHLSPSLVTKWNV